MKKLLVCFIIGLSVLTACSLSPRLKDEATQLYSGKAGYQLSLPADWQLASDDDKSVVFTAPDEDLSLTIVSELGGEAYYNLDEIANMLLAKLPGSSSPWEISRTIVKTDEKLRLAVQGTDPAGAEVSLDITVLQPYPGMRYYLLFAASHAASLQQGALISDIVNSFKMTEDQTYLYKLMEEWRAAETPAEDSSTPESPAPESPPE